MSTSHESEAYIVTGRYESLSGSGVKPLAILDSDCVTKDKSDLLDQPLSLDHVDPNPQVK